MSAAASPRRHGLSGSPVIRRLWILPVTIVVVAALGYLASGLQSSVYTAQSTVVVSSAPGPVNANVSAATDLATTYSAALPHDPRLQRYVSSTAHVPVTSRSIGALPNSGSLVRLSFRASSASAAMSGAKAIASGLSGATPQSAVVSSGSLKLLQGPTGTTSTIDPVTGLATYSAAVVFVVPSASGPTEGINPDDASKLATTYAGIITSDDALLADVGRATGMSSSEVTQDLSVTNTQSTSILQLAFKASDPNKATTGARVVAQLLTGPHPIAAGIVPSSVQIVSLPRTPATSAKSSKKGIAIGAAIGLLLGIVLLVAWERSDPRVRDPRELSSQIGCPATPLDRLSPNAAFALLERWASLTNHVPARVAVVPADSGVVAETAECIAVLRDGGGDFVRYLDARSGALPELPENGGADGETGVILVHAPPPGGEGAGEAVALGCDLTVVAVPAGARSADIRRVAEELTNFGIVPVWALLTPRTAARARQRGHLADVVSR